MRLKNCLVFKSSGSDVKRMATGHFIQLKLTVECFFSSKWQRQPFCCWPLNYATNTPQQHFAQNVIHFLTRLKKTFPSPQPHVRTFNNVFGIYSSFSSLIGLPLSYLLEAYKECFANQAA